MEASENKRAERAPEANQRDTLYISHATPADNAFATWLASRLSMAGYKVWCDQQKLLGGEDFWQDIEKVLRDRTVKFVLVISENAFDESGRLRDGIAKEFALADILKRQIRDDYFVIPMRIDNTSFSDFPIDFIRLNGIDCGANWASGLDALIKVFERDSVAHSVKLAEPSLKAWRQIHQHHTRALSQDGETLQSNWLPIEELPEQIHVYEILRPMKPAEPRVIASDCALPCVDHGRLLASFATQEELQMVLGESNPIKLRGTLETQDFLRGRTGKMFSIAAWDAKNKMTSLVRQAWDNAMRVQGLTPYEMASGKLAWWFPEGIPQDGKLRFTDFNGKSRYRAVSGIRGKKEGTDGQEVPRYHWHLGFTGKPFLTDRPFLALQPRIIISDDGKTPLKSKTRLNSVRRSLTKMWFNDKWRGLVVGFSSWLADGHDSITLPVADHAALKLGAKPLTYESPFGVASDPVSFEISDDMAEKMDQAESQMRLSDPAFFTLHDEKGEE